MTERYVRRLSLVFQECWRIDCAESLRGRWIIGSRVVDFGQEASLEANIIEACIVRAKVVEHECFAVCTVFRCRAERRYRFALCHRYVMTGQFHLKMSPILVANGAPAPAFAADDFFVFSLAFVASLP